MDDFHRNPQNQGKRKRCQAIALQSSLDQDEATKYGRHCQSTGLIGTSSRSSSLAASRTAGGTGRAVSPRDLRAILTKIGATRPKLANAAAGDVPAGAYFARHPFSYEG